MNDIEESKQRTKLKRSDKIIEFNHSFQSQDPKFSPITILLFFFFLVKKWKKRTEMNQIRFKGESNPKNFPTQKIPFLFPEKMESKLPSFKIHPFPRQVSREIRNNSTDGRLIT